MRPSRRLLALLGGWFGLALAIGLLRIVEALFQSMPVISDALLIGWQMFGLLLLLVAIADALTFAVLGQLTALRRVSQNIAVGANTEVELKIINPLSSSVSIMVNDHYPQHSEVKGLPQYLTISPSSHAVVTYSLRVLQRGDAHFGRVILLAFTRLGLWQRKGLVGDETRVKVYPNFAAIHHYILLSADQQTSQLGIRRTQRRGDGLEFHQLREYRIGDSLRQIDWRATSRLGKLISKEYQEEKDQNIIFLLDCGRRMRTQDDELSHFDHSLNALLLLAYIGLKQGDAVGFMSFGGVSRWLAPAKGTQFINTLLNQVYDCHPTLQASDFIEAATELNKRIRKRSLVVLVSNLRDNDLTELQPALKLLNQHHLVLLANLREQALDRMVEQPVANFEQAITYSEAVEFLKHRQQVQLSCAREGVIALDTLPNHLATRLVNSYFEIKRSGRL
jgi:uncharacterized protein (DUF58 family)